MKKFVSFCLLSIMLAFFGIVETKAQNCLWLQNVDSTVPSYMATVLQPARPDATDVYEVMFHNGSLDPNTKISLAWTPIIPSTQ